MSETDQLVPARPESTECVLPDDERGPGNRALDVTVITVAGRCRTAGEVTGPTASALGARKLKRA